MEGFSSGEDSTQETGARAEQKAVMADEVELAADQHVRYIVTVEKVKSETTLPFPPRVPLTPPQLPTPPLVPAQKKDSFESLVMEHIRLNGAYWGPHHARPPPQTPRRRRRRGRRLDHVLLPPRIWYLPLAQSSDLPFPG